MNNQTNFMNNKQIKTLLIESFILCGLIGALISCILICFFIDGKIFKTFAFLDMAIIIFSWYELRRIAKYLFTLLEDK